MKTYEVFSLFRRKKPEMKSMMVVYEEEQLQMNVLLNSVEEFNQFLFPRSIFELLETEEIAEKGVCFCFAKRVFLSSFDWLCHAEIFVPIVIFTIRRISN